MNDTVDISSAAAAHGSETATQAYQDKQGTGVSPVKSVALLYDRACESLNRAIIAIEKDDINERWENNKRASEILAKLATSLDLNNGGEIAQNLDRLYRFMMLRLMDVDVRNDAEAAKEVLSLLEPLRVSWNELAKQTDKEQENANSGVIKADITYGTGEQEGQITSAEILV